MARPAAPKLPQGEAGPGAVAVSENAADRDGAVTESELTRFNNLTYYMSETLNRSLQFDMTIEEALPEAERLSRFCQEFDLLAVIHVEPPPGKGFSGPDVARALECGAGWILVGTHRVAQVGTTRPGTRMAQRF